MHTSNNWQAISVYFEHNSKPRGPLQLYYIPNNSCMSPAYIPTWLFCVQVYDNEPQSTYDCTTRQTSTLSERAHSFSRYQKQAMHYDLPPVHQSTYCSVCVLLTPVGRE